MTGFNHNHPSIWLAIDSIRKDAAFVQHHINELSSGARPRTGVKQEFVKLQEKLKILCNNLQDGLTSLPEFLSNVAKNIRFIKC